MWYRSTSPLEGRGGSQLTRTEWDDFTTTLILSGGVGTTEKKAMTVNCKDATQMHFKMF